MKIGIICEGAETDKPVIELILKHKFPSTTFEIIARDKRAIFSTCYEDIADLLRSGIQHIAVVWDLLPVGHQMPAASQWSEKPSRKEQRHAFLRNLDTDQNPHGEIRTAARAMLVNYGFEETPAVAATMINIKLICVCYTLDGWLLSDSQVIRRVGSSPIREMECASLEAPDRCINPAGLLTKVFRSAPNKRFKFYNKHQHNIEIIRSYIDQGKLDKLCASLSYQRMISTIQGWGAL
ncbi:hypothetical protein G3N56_03590 [Desulfovibrio sulfodismutans]|uniref:DUF4276 family protein n=1 Tax=Desulfolutivibrio sulfodismutans TaxID=63561 RepID=A0A7K3NHZ2_9BACT|nr:hypothetical protein [Desulfolutivibrio sulfodismutans]NDY55824.1 hypothetical protein [Desulfolutivibrio sulfodismutans]QLA14227.1 hypothetical protein GD606_19130 [Desulfolutivibrio sulfodismutans DSM 3696]